MCLPRTEAQALIIFRSPADFILTIAVVFGPISSPAHKPRLLLPLSQRTPSCTQSNLPPSRVPALVRRSLASRHAPVGTWALRGTWGWQRWPPWGWWAEVICGFWLVSIPSWPCKGLLCSPGRLPVLTIAPFKVTQTPRLGATTGLRDQVNSAPLCPGHPREGEMGEQTSYSLLRDLVGSGAWHTAHRATTGLAKRVFGQIPHIALELEQKPTRTKSCPSLHPGTSTPPPPPTLQHPVCEELKEEDCTFPFVFGVDNELFSINPRINITIWFVHFHIEYKVFNVFPMESYIEC